MKIYIIDPMAIWPQVLVLLSCSLAHGVNSLFRCFSNQETEHKHIPIHNTKGISQARDREWEEEALRAE